MNLINSMLKHKQHKSKMKAATCDLERLKANWTWALEDRKRNEITSRGEKRARKSLARKLEWATGRESCQKIVWPESPECGKSASRRAEGRKQSSADGGRMYPGTVAVRKEASSHFPARVIFRPHSDSLRQAGLSLEAQSWLICITKNPRWKTGNERRDLKKKKMLWPMPIGKKTTT